MLHNSCAVAPILDRAEVKRKTYPTSRSEQRGERSDPRTETLVCGRFLTTWGKGAMADPPPGGALDTSTLFGLDHIQRVLRNSSWLRESWVSLISVQLLSPVQFFATPCTAARQTSLSITNSLSLLKLMSIESVMPSSHLILCHPLLLPPSIFPSFRVFSSESVLRIRWPKCWSFSFSISPSNEYSGLISVRINWSDLLAVQRTLKSLLQHHSSNASILQRTALWFNSHIHT